MKKLSELSILSASAFLFILSCSKSSSGPSANNVVTFSFNANGTNYDWVSTYKSQYAFIHFIPTNSIPEAQFNAGDSTNISIDDTLSLSFILAVTSLSQKTYNLDSIISSQINVLGLKNGATWDSPTSPPSWV